MVRRFHRSIYDELDELRASMDYLYQLAFEPADNSLLPGDENPLVVSQYVHYLNAEVTECDDEVTVTVDTVPGPGNAKISVDLIDGVTLAVTCEQEEEERNDTTGTVVREQLSVSRCSVVPLPVPVVKDGARLSLKHGVFDIHLKRMQPVLP